MGDVFIGTLCLALLATLRPLDPSRTDRPERRLIISQISSKKRGETRSGAAKTQSNGRRRLEMGNAAPREDSIRLITFVKSFEAKEQSELATSSHEFKEK